MGTYSETLNMYALNISQASYCVESSKYWECATCAKSIEIINVVENGGIRVLNGIDVENNKIIISFRGSSNIHNWLDNIQFGHIYPYKNYPEVSVDKGFYKAYSYVRDDINKFVQEQIISHPSYHILITGHSLGGALSTMAAFESIYLENIKSENIELLTYGSPRLGNQEFKQYMQKMVFSWRTTHNYDIVPHVPEEFLDYIHISHEVWYNKDNSHYTICNDETSEDKSCSDSCAPTKCKSTADHLNYLNISMGNDGLC